VLRRSMPPTAVLLVCFVSATSIGVAVGDQVPVVTMAA
jgi:hypothetical protein